MKAGFSNKPPAKVPGRPAQGTLKTAPLVRGKSGPVSNEHRRTQRVLLRVKANVHVALQGQATTLEASTVSVHPAGALVVLKQNLPVETRLVLEHAATKQKVGCRVPRGAKAVAEGFQVPVEFDSPAPDFWKIAFPPQDWRPEEG